MIITDVKNQLKKIEKENNINIIFACESGSRGWGFPSPDSDYDVRFIYLQSKEKYISIDALKDTIEIPIQDDLDIGGWDLKKVLQHIKKSNPVIFEWMQSPIKYYISDKSDKLIFELCCEYFSPRTAMNHYLGIAKNAFSNLTSTGDIKIKKIFYVLRPLFTALWIGEHMSIPPMEFEKLLEMVHDDSIIRSINNLLEKKRNAIESFEIKIDDVLVSYIDKAIVSCSKVSEKADSINVSSDKLNEFFIQLVDRY